MAYRGTSHLHRRDAGEESQREFAGREHTNRYWAHQQHGSRYPVRLPPFRQLPQYAGPQERHAPSAHPNVLLSYPAPPLAYQTQQPAPRGPELSLWSSFKVRDKSFYTFGRVFKVAPHEKVGESKNPEDEKFITKDCFDRLIISKPRICIVLEEHEGYCNVVTINGYSDRGLNKKSTDPSEHALARTNLDQSPPSKEEFRRARQMLQEPIYIVPDKGCNKVRFLQPKSVIDFGKVVTIQHYHEAELFGFVADESIDTLRRHYNSIRSKSTAPRTIASSSVDTPRLESVEYPTSCLPTAISSPFSNGCQQPSISPSFLTDRPYVDSLLGLQSAEIYKYIFNSAGTEEERDGAFRQQPREFYSWGAVFRLLSWEEEPTDEESEITEMISSESEQGTPILRRVLWLVVIQEGQESCKCLRIMTYEGRGVRELPPGLSRGDHSIIYTGCDIPQPNPEEMPTSPGESQLGSPIRVRQCNRMEKLFPTARLLWTRVYDVKLDVKAKAFGRIPSRYDHVLETQFKVLNPHSSIEAGRPRSSGLVDIAGRDGYRLAEERRSFDESARSPSNSYASEDPDSDGSEVSSEGSSPVVLESSERKGSGGMYDPGDAVVLLTGKDGPSSHSPWKPLLINTARVQRDEDGELVWKYSLDYTHGGRFSGGRYFDEGLIMPA